MRTIAFAASWFCLALSFPAAAQSPGDFAAAAANREGNAQVRWGKTMKEAKQRAAEACARVSKTCTTDPSSTRFLDDYFALICCNQPALVCSAPSHETREKAAEIGMAFMSHRGVSDCSVRAFYSARTGQKEVAEQAPKAKCPESVAKNAELDKMIREATAWINERGNVKNNAAGYNNRAVAYVSYGQFELAIQDLEAGKRLTGKYSCPQCLVRAYLGLGKLDVAITVIDGHRAERGTTQDDGLSCLRGIAHYRKGHYDHADADFEKAILLPDDGITNFGSCGLFGRGLVKLKRGHSAEGKTEMIKAEEAGRKVAHGGRYDAYFCIHGVQTP